MSSPYNKFKKIGIGDCQWTKGFWADKFKVCESSMLPYMEKLLCGNKGHALNNFKIAAGLKKGKHKGMFWHDGDFYKWMEAAVYVYAQNKDKKILKQLDQYIEIIAKAQDKDGYLQTQIQLREEVDRYENRKYHEMYNTGHLLISACIHHNVTKKSNFPNIAIKQADLLYTLFYPETKQLGRFGFNQTQIMGLVELYRATDDKKYLELAARFINRRGKYEVDHNSTTIGYPIGDMVQERVPLRKSKEAAGHAVLALYYYAGAADVYAETGERALKQALDRLWENITQKKMYVTGAVGQAHYGASSNRDKIEEGFIDDFMLPNMTAYNETCANLCNAMFSYRMLGIKGESKYADIIELVLFNSGLSGINIEGNKYFYANPLRMIHNSRAYNSHENATETPERECYLECFCCPPNLVRTVAKLSSWAYSITANGLAINLFGGNKLKTKLDDGSELQLIQKTNYPWDGNISIKVKKCKSSSFEILIRIPDWANGSALKINEKEVNGKISAGKYLKLKRRWKSNDTIDLSLPIHTQLVEAHPRVEEARNQIAVKRGPVVYCVETPDLPTSTEILDVYLQGNSNFESKHQKDFLGGVTTLKTDLLIRKDKKTDKLYNSVSKPKWKTHATQLVPYFAWSNRGKAEMTVFLPVLWNKEN